MKRSNCKDRIPAHFRTIEEAAEFFDTHDMGDYWDETVPVEMHFNVRRRHFYVSVLPEIAGKLRRLAEKKGVSAETVVNLWLMEKLQAAR